MRYEYLLEGGNSLWRGTAFLQHLVLLRGLFLTIGKLYRKSLRRRLWCSKRTFSARLNSPRFFPTDSTSFACSLTPRKRYLRFPQKAESLEKALPCFPRRSKAKLCKAISITATSRTAFRQ